MGQGKRIFTRMLVISVLIAGFCAFFIFSCETENAVVNLALKKDNKTYLFSKMGDFIVESSLEKGESPAAFGFIRLFEDDGLYVAPNDCEEIVDVLAGNYHLYPYQEKSYEGYITSGEKEIFTTSFSNVSTEKIGEQIRESRIEIVNPVSAQVLEIVWTYNQKTGESKAVQNCELKSFWITTSVQPGETVTSSEDFIMVDLNELVEFFDNGSTLEYNADEEILYIVEN